MPVDLSPGTIVGGDFVVERFLGEGGMGAVYVARQRSTNRLRALKVLTPSLSSDPKFADRFSREAMAGSLIESEHVVEVIAAGFDPNLRNMPWLAMEYLDGEELSNYVARQSGQCLDRRQALLVLEQVFHALSAAHRAGVVHRDLKPENIFLAKAKRVGAPFVVKVLDFGIAKVLRESHGASRTGRLGTPGWMAPEQLESGLALPAADVWALGLVAFFVLTGRRFWLRENDPNASVAMLMYEMLMEPIALASVRAGQYGCGHLIPPGFDDWFSVCMSREPRSRFADASLAWERLRPLLEQPQRSTESLAGAVAGVASQAQTLPYVPPAPAGSPVATDEAPTHLLDTKPAPLPQATAPMTHHPVLGLPGVAPDVPAEQPRAATRDAWAKGKTEVPAQQADTLAHRHGHNRTVLLISSVGAGTVLALAAVGLAFGLRSGSSDTAAAPASTPSAVPPRRSASVAPVAPPSRPPVPEMIAIHAGADTVDGKTVLVTDFEMDRLEVSVAKYQACVEAKACDGDVATVNVAGAGAWSVLCNWPKRAERSDHAMNCVSRNQAEAYCRWVGKKLPTEDQWVYAAYVAGGARAYPWGEGAPSPGTINLCGTECVAMLRASKLVPDMNPIAPAYTDGFAATSPVEAFTQDSSPVGVVGLGGNVMEWTATSIGKDKARCRGGNWLTNAVEHVASKAQYTIDIKDRRANLGFRCAR